MRRPLLASFASLALVAACNGSPATSGTDGGGVTAMPDLLDTRTTQSLGIGPIALAAGQERTVCSRFRLPNASAIDVVQIGATLLPGSHHLILYKSNETVEKKDVYDCEPLDLRSNDVPLYIAETANNNTLPLPSGVAYHLEAGQMVRLEAHYLNATSTAEMGMGNVVLTLGAAGVTYQAADIMFCGSVSGLTPALGGKGVLPGHTTLPYDFFKPPAGVKIFGLTTHEHKRGSLMTVDKAIGPDDPNAESLTHGTPYDNPPFRIWKDPDLLSFAPDSKGFPTGLRWQCQYDNASTNTYYFGQSAEKNEMCFLWAYYYPSVGHFVSQECWR